MDDAILRRAGGQQQAKSTTILVELFRAAVAIAAAGAWSIALGLAR